MGIQDFFWIPGDEDGGDDVPPLRPTQVTRNTTQVSNINIKSLTASLLDLLSDEVKFFESQLKLFDKTTSSESQLVSIVMVTLAQKFPNMTKRELVKMYDANRPILAQLQREIVTASDNNIDSQSAAVRSDHDNVVHEINDIKVKLQKLQNRETKLQEQSAAFIKQKKEFASKISGEHTSLLGHIDAQITILNKSSEET